RIIAGLEEPTSGDVVIGDRRVTDLPPAERDVAMVFQSYALYPHLSVQENIAYPLKVRKVPAAERERAVREVAEALEVAHLLERRPRQLSGGQRQRIALARAIVRQPRAFLMDEPLSNLDARLRLTMRGEIKRLQHRLGTTTLYVTHDQAEALTMADRIAVLREGVLQQVGAPAEIYDRPANRFVATFVGSPPMNVLRLELDRDRRQLVVAGTPLPGGEARYEVCAAAGAVEIGVRPEDVRLVEPDRPGAIRGEVYVVEPTGNETLVEVLVGGERLTARAPRDFDAAIGSRIGVELNAAAACFFDASARCVEHRVSGSGRAPDPVGPSITDKEEEA
ncbi:MAG TPA: ABC transporter ATP-binding protein, partial [Gaiellaceae bacterium]|nr:ABC transporter ATP-binding protein [Gaiellaceae bacterium]